MKTLKAHIQEGILDDVESNLKMTDPYKTLYPVPKARDFKRNFWGGQTIEWICPGLIQEYIDVLDGAVISPMVKPDIISFRVDLRDKYIMDFYLGCNANDYKGTVELVGFGSDGSSMPNQKKAVLEFFKYIQNNPSELKKVFEYVNKRQNELNTKGECDCWTFKQLLKY